MVPQTVPVKTLDTWKVEVSHYLRWSINAWVQQCSKFRSALLLRSLCSEMSQRWYFISRWDLLSISNYPHLFVLLCEQVALVPALVAGGGGMEGSGGELRCLKSRKTEVNPVLNILVKPLVLFFNVFIVCLFFPFLGGAESSGDGFFFFFFLNIILALVNS